MITIEQSIVVEKKIHDVWEFFNDMDSLVKCMPTVIRYEIGEDDTVRCDLRIKLGLISLDSKAKVKVLEREEERRIVLGGHTLPGESLKRFGRIEQDGETQLHMILDFQKIDAHLTQIKFRLTAKAVGQLKRVYESIIRGQRSKIENQIVANLEEELNTKVLERAAEAD